MADERPDICRPIAVWATAARKLSSCMRAVDCPAVSVKVARTAGIAPRALYFRPNRPGRDCCTAGAGVQLLLVALVDISAAGAAGSGHTWPTRTTDLSNLAGRAGVPGGDPWTFGPPRDDVQGRRVPLYADPQGVRPAVGPEGPGRLCTPCWDLRLYALATGKA